MIVTAGFEGSAMRRVVRPAVSIRFQGILHVHTGLHDVIILRRGHRLVVV